MRNLWVCVLLATVFGLSGCETVNVGTRSSRQGEYERVEKKGPPPWAPAHGYRNKVRYRYYPGQEIYYNIDRGQYVWLEHGAWRLGARLPDYIRLGDSVIVEIEGNHPNLYHRQIVQSYPPGQARKYRSNDRGRDEKQPQNRKPGKDDKRGKGRGNSQR